MALTALLGVADSMLGNIVPGLGSVIPSAKIQSSSDSGVMSDAASAAHYTTLHYIVSASDSARFTGTSSVSPGSQTVIGWVSPEQSTVFRQTGGFSVTPNSILGVSVYNSTVSFDFALSNEYAGGDVLVTVFWTGNLSAASWSGNVKVQIFNGPWQASNNCWTGTMGFTFSSGVWSLQETRIILLAASAPFPLVPGQVYTIAFTVNPTGTPGGFGSSSVPFLLLEAEVQNK